MSEGTDISKIEHRVPIVNEETGCIFSANELDRQWRLVTEKVRKDSIAKPEVRKTLVPFCSEQVSEALPGQFLSLISKADEGIAKLVRRYKEILLAYLNLSPVPDEQIQPDVSNAPYLQTPDETVRKLKFLPRVSKVSDADDKEREIYNQLQSYIDSGVFMKGITKEERQMIARRYRYARDVKILALGAEILDQESLKPDPNGEIALPSGIKIGFDTEQTEQRVDLLTPHLWERRRQIKDRVYEISVGGRSYILKEKKTSRHTDTKKGGHRAGRSSKEEFSIARQFRKQGRLNKGHISVDWERPIGFVSYPDGFQFAIFEYEEGLINDQEIISSLSSEILKNRAKFEKEYQSIADLAQKKCKDNPEAMDFEEQESEADLTFEEFATVKAWRMKEQALELMQDIVDQNEYYNRDMDGYAFRVHTDGDVKLNIVGFDFEYFEKVSSEEVSESRRIRKEFLKQDFSGIGIAMWNNTREVTRMERAAYDALLDVEQVVQAA